MAKLKVSPRKQQIMFNTLLKKSWRDLWLYKTRSVVIILSIGICTLLMGVILVSYSLLSREMNEGFLKAQPHALSFKITSFDEGLIQEIMTLPTVEKADARQAVAGQIQRSNGDWVPMILFVLRDYQNIALDILVPETGSWPPKDGEVLIERQALSVLRGNIGDTVTLKTHEDKERRLKLTGLVFDIVQPQAEMENIVYAYVSSKTLQNIGGPAGFNQLNIALSGNPTEIDFVRQKAAELRFWLKQKGYPVHSVDIPLPGKHPHYSITRSMFIIQESFGIFLCLFCSLLVYNLMSSTLSSQLRQIGVMKSIGGRMPQIAKIYFFNVLTLGLTGLMTGMPLVPLLGKLYAEKMAAMMNFNIVDDAASPWVYIIVIGLGLCIPLFAASIPILQASRIPIREAMVSYGLRQKNFGHSIIDRLLSSIPFLNRPILIALRNTFRKKGRLILTLIVLSLGATFYITALNLEASVEAFVRELQATKAWGLKVNLNRPYDIERISQHLYESPEVSQVEPFISIRGNIVDDSGETIMSLPLTGIDPGSAMLKRPFLKGNWLDGSDNKIVINQFLVDRLPYLKPGNTIMVKIGGTIRQFQICGIVGMVGLQHGYINFNEATTLAGNKKEANGFFVNGENSQRRYLWQLKQKVYKRLKDNDLELDRVVTSWQGIEVLEDHFEIIYLMILTLTIIVLFIGANGIILSMRTNIIERTREIGVLKAIGAGRSLLLVIIIGEGLFIGLSSWLFAIIISIPISYLVTSGIGMVLIQQPLPLVPSIYSYIIALPLMLAISAFACYWPASGTAKLSVREALMYE